MQGYPAILVVKIMMSLLLLKRKKKQKKQNFILKEEKKYKEITVARQVPFASKKHKTASSYNFKFFIIVPNKQAK